MTVWQHIYCMLSRISSRCFKLHCKTNQILSNAGDWYSFTRSVYNEYFHTCTISMRSKCPLFLLDACKSLSGTLNPQGHGTHRDQCSPTRTHNTWTVVCYIPGNERLLSHSCVLETFGCTDPPWACWIKLSFDAQWLDLNETFTWCKRSLSWPDTRMWPVSPLVDSSSIGCLKSVMSLKVQRKSTTLSFSFLIGATCM